MLRWPPEPGHARGCCWWSPDDSWLSREARSLRAACLLVHSGTEPQIHAEHEDGDPPPAAQGARACRVRRAVGERRAPPPSSAKRSSPGPDVSVTSHLAVPARGCDAGFRARSSGPPPARGPCSARTGGATGPGSLLRPHSGLRSRPGRAGSVASCAQPSCAGDRPAASLPAGRRPCARGPRPSSLAPRSRVRLAAPARTCVSSLTLPFCPSACPVDNVPDLLAVPISRPRLRPLSQGSSLDFPRLLLPW